MLLPKRNQRLRWLAIGLAATMTTLTLTASPAAANPAAKRQHGVVLNTKVAPTGYYAGPATRADGHIDIAQTLNAISQHHANTYQYLVANKWGFNSSKDWADLPAFLAAAQRWHIKVWVILLPPTEASQSKRNQPQGDCKSTGYLPYNGNYNAWYTAIGKLAKRYPALAGSGMDDYPYSVGLRCKTFNGSEPIRWTALQTKAAGRVLPFAPTIYYVHLTGWQRLVEKGKLTTVVYPFTEFGYPKELIRKVALLHKRYPKLRLIVMVYAAPVRNRPIPTAASVDAEVKAAKSIGAKGGVIGVVVYQQRLVYTPKKK